MKSWSILIVSLCIAFKVSAQETERPPYYIFSIYYGGGNYYITENQKQGLAKFLDEIPDIDQHEISVHGHTDDIGGREYNQWLSEMRCQSAITELLKNFLIREEQISIEEFGELNPVYDNSTWEGKLKNRRVDVIIRPVIL
ncbi:MAG: OmpA family protein [Bacteroidota bacterium]